MNLHYRSNNYDVLSINDCTKLIKSLNHKTLFFLFDKLHKYTKKTTKINDLEIKFVGKGQQGVAYLLKNKKCGYIIFKLSKQYDIFNNENKIILKCKKLVDDFVSPNFLYYYDNFKMGRYDVILSEYANGTLKDWMLVEHTYDEWKSFLYNFLIMVLCIQKYLKGVHNDLGKHNIFYKKINDNIKYFGFNIKFINKKYYVPTYGHLFMAADFGLFEGIEIDNKFANKKDIQLKIDNNFDLHRIIMIEKRTFIRAINKMYKLSDLLKIIKTNNDNKFNAKYEKYRDKIHKLYSYKEIETVNKKLYDYVSGYIMDNEYVKYADLSNDIADLKLPPRKILDELMNWKNKSIYDILNNYDNFLSVPDINDDQIINFNV